MYGKLVKQSQEQVQVGNPKSLDTPSDNKSVAFTLHTKYHRRQSATFRVKPSETLFTYKFSAMGVPSCFQFYCDSKVAAQNLFKRCLHQVRRLEAKYAQKHAGSIINFINTRAGYSTSVDHETAAILNFVDTAYYSSEGLFDITTGALKHIWDLKERQIPNSFDVVRAKRNVGWEKVKWDGSNIQIQKGMEIDLGGIAKEYIADAIAKYAHNFSVRMGLVNIAGEIAIIGPRPNNKPWLIDIKHPDKNQPNLSISVSHGAIASSANHTNDILEHGMRYGRILNPNTGFPCQRMTSVTVSAPLCIIAGTVATVAMLKEFNAEQYLKHSGLEYVAFKQMGKSYQTLSNASYN